MSVTAIDMLQAFDNAVARDLTVVERIDLPARPERREAIPEVYKSGAVGRWLNTAQFANGVWTHQAEALRRIETGVNVVVSTGTASGKSLIFQAAALRTVDLRPDAVVLVIYPLKALVAD